MNFDQFEKIKNISLKRTVHINSLSEKNDRTLLYGCTLMGDTFHVDVQNGLLHKVIYSSNDEARVYDSGDHLSLDGIIPCKRLYPKYCDFEFCLILTKAGIDLSFTSWTERPASTTLYERIVKTVKNLLNDIHNAIGEDFYERINRT